MSAALAFDVPERLEATEPPPERDRVRMLVASRAGIRHATFLDLPDLLVPGDLLVVNTSATLPAALPVDRPGDLRVHLSTPLPEPPGLSTTDGGGEQDGTSPRGGYERLGSWRDDGYERWVIELRVGGAPYAGGRAGERLPLPDGGRAELLAPYLGGRRLWAARLRLPEPLLAYLERHGEPIRYRHLREPRPLADFQTIFADEPGSAEMPSAGRPFSERVLARLEDRGVAVAAVVLHTGVSSLERGESPYPERFRVPAGTAAAVNRAARVIAVGTTVVRALESAAGEDGTVRAAEGWTRLLVEPERGVRAVDGILTGWHDPDSSHLLMLEAVGGRALVERSYAAALADGYRWHEFGDSHLLLAG
jgi:S-adenosylmethionine:tRNA ribosyltransferase-isomerase